MTHDQASIFVGAFPGAEILHTRVDPLNFFVSIEFSNYLSVKVDDTGVWLVPACRFKLGKDDQDRLNTLLSRAEALVSALGVVTPELRKQCSHSPVNVASSIVEQPGPLGSYFIVMFTCRHCGTSGRYTLTAEAIQWKAEPVESGT